jgi:hypothetical protein
LSIPAIAEQLGGVELPDPVALAPALGVVLGKVTDPRKARGIRHRLVVLLTVTVCAVAAGARSFVAVAEWVADLPMALADTLGTGDRCPSESTIRRAVRDIDADAFDTVIGGFVQQRCAPQWPRLGDAEYSRWTARPCADPATPMLRAPSRQADICSR